MSRVITVKTFERFFPKITPVVTFEGAKYNLLECIEKEVTIAGDTKTSHYELKLLPIEPTTYKQK